MPIPAGVINQNAHRAQRLFDLFQRRLQLAPFSDIEPERQGRGVQAFSSLRTTWFFSSLRARSSITSCFVGRLELNALIGDREYLLLWIVEQGRRSLHDCSDVARPQVAISWPSSSPSCSQLR
jgi:hypothetical protein